MHIRTVLSVINLIKLSYRCLEMKPILTQIGKKSFVTFPAQDVNCVPVISNNANISINILNTGFRFRVFLRNTFVQ